MELAVTIVSAVVTLVGMAYKWWSARQEAKKLEVAVAEWRRLANKYATDCGTLRKLLAEKEVELVKAQTDLAARMSASELVDSLNGLFGNRRGNPPGVP